MVDLQPIRIALDQLLPQAKNIVVAIDGTGELYPEERACIAHASDSRQQEFKAGRIAARQALAQLGVKDFPLLKGEQGEPLWPSGVVGSISHSGHVCIASIANANELEGVGIDIQQRRQLKLGIERMTCSEEELSLDWHEHRDTALLILFSAKEAAYKALYPRIKKYIGFKDVTVQFREGSQYSINFEGIALSGGYVVLNEYIIAVCF